ncbi:MAG: LysM domain-containing protein [Planctomycetota bacterium]
MPLDPRSRYQGLDTYEVSMADESVRPSVPIRRSPAASPERALEHVVIGGEDLEYLAWRYYGDSRQWWRIADANGLQFPTDVRSGTTVRIPGRSGIGGIVRTRKF